MRKSHGRFMPRHFKDAFHLSYDGVASRFPSFPHWFPAVEVPQGFWAEHPPVVTYKGSVLMSLLTSGYWAVFRTEFSALVAARLLYEDFKKNRVWYLPSMLRT